MKILSPQILALTLALSLPQATLWGEQTKQGEDVVWNTTELCSDQVVKVLDQLRSEGKTIDSIDKLKLVWDCIRSNLDQVMKHTGKQWWN